MEHIANYKKYNLVSKKIRLQQYIILSHIHNALQL